ncbi:MAG: hypothetical protein Q9160_000872 [Pyrenula sp. 1 TL-2023]
MDRLYKFYASATGREQIGTIDFSQSSLLISAASILFNPLFWNIVARQEYHTHFMTKAFGSPYRGCYALAIAIFTLGIVRDHFYNSALSSQPIYPAIHQPIIGYGLIAAGNVLVLSSFWALGITGTFLGDYFGILMDSMVEGFPFNVTGSPMYWGSTSSFLGVALVRALRYEDPFTSEIYAKKEKEVRPVTRSMTKERKKA